MQFRHNKIFALCCSAGVYFSQNRLTIFFFCRPELFRFESLLKNDNRTNLDHAFNVANEEFSVPKLLDPAGERVFLLPVCFYFAFNNPSHIEFLCQVERRERERGVGGGGGGSEGGRDIVTQLLLHLLDLMLIYSS